MRREDLTSIFDLFCFFLYFSRRRLRTRFTKSCRRWTRAKTWWRSVWARSKRSWPCSRRLLKPCRKPFRAICPWSTIRPVSSNKPARKRRATTPTSYNDDSNSCTPNRHTEVEAAQTEAAAGEESLIRDRRPVPGRLRPLRRRRQLRPRRQVHCPYLRNRLSHRRCHPSPNSANSLHTLVSFLFFSFSLFFPHFHHFSSPTHSIHPQSFYTYIRYTYINMMTIIIMTWISLVEVWTKQITFINNMKGQNEKKENKQILNIIYPNAEELSLFFSLTISLRPFSSSEMSSANESQAAQGFTSC